MIKLEIKQFTMLAVGLIVGVLLITGVVAPVIVNVTGDSGDVQPTNVSYDDYTNTGDVYLMEPDGTEHQIIVRYADSKMYFVFDGETFLEKALGSESWDIPLVWYKTITYPTESFDVFSWNADKQALNWHYTDYSVTDIPDTDGICFSITTNYNDDRDAVLLYSYWRGEPYDDNYTAIRYISPNGDYVFTKNPVVYNNSTIGIYSYFEYENFVLSGMTGILTMEISGVATFSKWQEEIDEHYPHVSCGCSFHITDGFGYDLESFTVTVHSHDVGEANQLDDLTFNITLGLVEGDGVSTIEYEYKVEWFVVPTTATYVPDNGFWKMADNSVTDIYTDYMGNNIYGVFTEDPQNGGSPFITGSISGNESFILPILIGESFIGYIEWIPGTPDWNAEIHFYGIGIQEEYFGFALTGTNHVHIEGGTISFTSWDDDEYSSDGLLAYISPDGEYTSFTEPTNAELSYIGFMGGYSYSSYDYVAGDMAGVDINVIGVMSGTDLSYISGRFSGSISVDGSEDNWDAIEYALTTSNTLCQIDKSNGMLTGLTISTQDKSFSIPIGYSNDETSTDDLYESVGGDVFAVGLIGSNSGGGGSGSAVSPTLSTLLSVIPLLMIVGLVIGAIAFFKMRS